jgi:hypothetical protein
MTRLPLLLLLCAAGPALAYELNGLRLGGSERDVRKVQPSAHCKPLEWKSSAADRRCDDARVALDGVPGKITVFLRADAIEAYELRFEMKELERVKAALRARWGAPGAEATETVVQRNGKDRKVFKMRWDKGAERAVLTAQLEKGRFDLEVSRGNFPEEIYRVR